MTDKRKLLLAKSALILSIFPLLLYAYSSGPDPGYSGVPGEFGTCTACHRGTVNSGGGSVTVSFANGQTYTPGVKQRLTVSVQDSAQRRWGFQMTARLANSSATQAGSFSAGSDGFTQVLCFTSNFGCASDTDLQYVEHTSQGTRPGTANSASFEFDWTPPANNVGDIILYVAGNAANGDGNNGGDHIYTVTYTVTPASSAQKPTISRVENGAGFHQTISPGSWLDVRGTNLASTTTDWNKDRAVVNGKLPTKLPSSNTAVTIDGKAAYVYYVSPTQINVLAPAGVGTGNVQVVVTHDGVSSDVAVAASDSFSPALFLWPGSYAVATHQDFTWAVKAGEFQGVETTPAKPGEVLILWGTGFGPTNPPAPDGQVVPIPASATDPVYNMTTAPLVTIGGKTASYLGGALAPGSAGLYQIAVKVPDLADGDWPVSIQIGGLSSPGGVLLTVKK